MTVRKKNSKQTLKEAAGLWKMPGEAESQSQPAIKRVVLALRADALAAEPGTFMGQEEDLLQRYGVSRPTLRQAASILTQEEVLRVRAGIRGGYFANRPTYSAVCHMAAIYLHSEGATLQHLLQVAEPIRYEVARLAAENLTPELRQELLAFLAADEVKEEYTFRDYIEASAKACDLLGRATGNPPLRMFLQIAYDLSYTVSPDQYLYLHYPDRYNWARDQLNQLIRAVLDGDGDLAVLLSRRVIKKELSWLVEGKAREALRLSGRI